MIKPGSFALLTLIEKSPFGVYANTCDNQRVFLLNTDAPKSLEAGATFTAFIYLNADNQLMGTTEPGLAKLNEFARLTVKEVNNIGAFLDWGLPKDLFVPFAEQTTPLKPDQAPVVYIYENKADGRVTASTRLDRFLETTAEGFKVGDRVDILVTDKTDLGMKAIINHRVLGMIHHFDLHKKLKYGQKLTAYIKFIREDGKADLTLNKPGMAGRDDLAEKILTELKRNEGIMAITDKSPPELIAKLFGVSKKQFKTALGKLYKERVIEIDARCIKLIDQ